MVKSYIHLSLFITLCLLAIAGTLVLLKFPPLEHKLFPECVLNKEWGLYCSGCGATRSAGALIRFQLLQSIAFNALVILLILPLFCLALLHNGLFAFRGRGIVTLQEIKAKWVLIVLLTAFGYGIIRNIPMKPFSYLAPIQLDASDKKSSDS